MVAALVAVPPSGHAQEDDVQPGVALRVHDLGGVSLSEPCTLRAGQTPSVDNHMPVIDHSAEADFEMADNCVSHTVAPAAGPGTRFRIVVDEAGSSDLGIRHADGPNPCAGDTTLRMRLLDDVRARSEPCRGPATREGERRATSRHRPVGRGPAVRGELF